MADVEKTCTGKFAFLGIEFDAPKPICWQADPLSRRTWPGVFHADLFEACDGNPPGDVKHVWELNRHEFLIDCAKAYLLTGDVQYARYVFCTIDSWIEQNPFLSGVNWTSALEVAMRSLSWLWSYQFCRQWEGLSAESHLKLIESLYQHGHYLYRNLSFYSSPYNHLVGEATALYLLGCFFPQFDEADAWECRGWGILSSEVEKQFHADGGNVEQATSYHYYCLGFFVLAVLQRMRRGEPVPAAMMSRVESAFEFGMWLTTPDGLTPRIGDTDDARSIRFSRAESWDFRNLIAVGATLFQRSDLKALAGPFSEDALWLLGPAGYETYQSLPAANPAQLSRRFCESGYSIIRSGWAPDDQYVCFDHGPLAAGLSTRELPSAAHGHSDMLSFVLSACGCSLLVDSGSYTYNGDPEWHRYFRESAAHNTVRVDGASQARYAGIMSWSCATQPESVRSSSCEKHDLVECSHRGYYGLGSRTRHRRAIVWKRGDYGFILDRLEGDGHHDVELFFHLSPCKIDSIAGMQSLSVHGNGRGWLLIDLVCCPSLEIELITGGDGPDGGWIATGYGQRERAPILRYHGRVQLPASFVTVCIPSREPLADVATSTVDVTDVRGRRIGDAVGCAVTRGGDRDIFAFCWDTQGAKQVEQHTFDGRMLHIRGTDSRVGNGVSMKPAMCTDGSAVSDSVSRQ